MITNQIIHLSDYQPHPRNYNAHSDEQIRRLAKSLSEFGQVRSIVVWRNTILAGHGVVSAALTLGWSELRADVLPDDWPEERALAYLVADNELARQADPDQAQLAAILEELNRIEPVLVEAAGYTNGELESLLRLVNPPAAVDAEPQIDRAEELRQKWQVESGQLWALGEHRLICGDCREPETWHRLLEGTKANGVFTSPPYAEQRKEQYGGVPTDEYVDWWEAVQASVRQNLASDGSFFVNIKPHCEDGERVLYVMDLVCAMVRRFEWRFIEEFCWLRNPTPKQVIEHFKQGFEPVYQFSLGKFKFKPDDVRHASDNVPIPGGKGTGNTNWAGRQGRLYALANTKGNRVGMAYPSTVLDFAKLGGQVESHAAAFPVALPSFFIRAYSDPGDMWIDPFCGSGTMLIAAEQNQRRGMGIELLPKYCAVALERFATATGKQPHLLEAAPVPEVA